MSKKKQILQLLEKNSLIFGTQDRLFSFLSSALDTDEAEVKRLFFSLIGSGDVFEVRKNKFITIPSQGYVKGEFFGTARGFGFVKSDGFSQDIFIPANKTKGALDGEFVIVKVFSKKEDGGADGEVVSIYKELENLVGTLNEVAGNFFVQPDNNKIALEIPVMRTGMKLQKNMKVLAQLIRTDSGKLKCCVNEILGFEDDVKALELSIIRDHNLFEKFPSIVEEVEKSVPKTVSEKKIKGRVDLRGETIFTIDGAEAKDLDDAVNIRKVGDFYEVGVHIADVGEYVPQGSVIDEEAFRRGTSVYFPTSVLPMLPKSLSNGICSLNEGVDRLTLSCLMKVNEKGQVVEHKICESVIRSVARLTYDEVYDAITGEKLNAKTKKLQKDFLLMRELCDILEANTHSRGALDLEVPEVEFVFDENGMAVDLKRRDRNEAHRLIEDFMVLANETVAKHFNQKQIPFVYRVHESPSTEKVQGVCDFLKGIGVAYPKIPMANAMTPAYYQEILEKVEGSAVGEVVNKVVLRSMQKAVYSNKDLGHFGLALKDYCHFTSPIRRYPDLTIHRIIKETLRNGGNLSAQRKEELDEFTFESAEQSSACERNADYAERDVDDLWKAYLLKDRVGEIFDAKISSVTTFGIFVALENTVEGLVRIENLPNDTYLFLERQLKLKGSAHVFSIGDKVRVKLTNVNLHNRNLDFEIAE